MESKKVIRLGTICLIFRLIESCCGSEILLGILIPNDPLALVLLKANSSGMDGQAPRSEELLAH